MSFDKKGKQQPVANARRKPLTRALGNPKSVKWPHIAEEDEKKILDVLNSIVIKYKSCLRELKKVPPWKKGKEEPEKLSDVEELQRKHFRSMLALGANSVIRNLENKNLQLVLMSKETQPAALKNAILEMILQHRSDVAENSTGQNVPAAACLSNILPVIQSSWPQLKSITVLGVLKTEKVNDFDELVKCVKTIAPPIVDDSNIAPTVLETTPTVVAKNDIDEPISFLAGTLKLVGDDTEAGHSREHTDMSAGSFEEHTGENMNMSTDPLPSGDYTKYYIYRKEHVERKFEGQNFIAFDDGTESQEITCTLIKFVNGKRTASMEMKENVTICGIRPPLSLSDLTHATETNSLNMQRKGKKRRLPKCANDGNSQYKGLSVQHLKPNENKVKRQKKQKDKNKK